MVHAQLRGNKLWPEAQKVKYVSDQSICLTKTFSISTQYFFLPLPFNAIIMSFFFVRPSSFFLNCTTFIYFSVKLIQSNKFPFRRRLNKKLFKQFLFYLYFFLICLNNLRSCLNIDDVVVRRKLKIPILLFGLVKY